MVKLFDTYVRDMEEWFAGQEDMMSRVYVKADRINKIIQRSGLNQDKKDDSEFVLIGIANLESEFSGKLKDLREMIIESEIKEKALREQIQQLELENERLRSSEITDGVVVERLEKLSDSIEGMLSLVESNIKTMALGEAMRTKEYRERDRHGEKSPRFIQEIDNEELIRMYRESNCTLTKEIVEYYKGKSGITYNGLMERLKTLGIWQYKNKK